MRVRWALEEGGLAYEERLIGPEDQASESYRVLQPFGQVPVYEENGLVLFESGAIVEIDLFHAGEEWAKLRRPAVVDAVKARLTALSDWLDGRDRSP